MGRRLGQAARAVGLTRTRRAPRMVASDGDRPQAGAMARELAHGVISAVLVDRTPLDQALSRALASPKYAGLESRDRAFAHSLAATVLRRKGELEHVLSAYLERPLPTEARRIWFILLAGAAQLICLGTPPHAVVDLAVAAVRRQPGGARFAGLTNAVLRRVASGGAGRASGQRSRAAEHPRLAVAALVCRLRGRRDEAYSGGQPTGGSPRYHRQNASG